MKNINITTKRQKTELMWLLGCFCLAFLLNLAAIIIYKTSWTELYSQIFWVLIIAFGLYAVTLPLRIIYDMTVRKRKN
ncbi:MAG: hypothetical protein LBD80_06490 [Tannerella sp.]|jgi:uncharacterized membrane protein YbhN (UPF0104 family)|nr:hypothetical protein [Tannerella sp.]